MTRNRARQRAADERERLVEQQVRVLPDDNGVRVIVCVGEFDADTLGPLKAASTAAADDPEVKRIVLDVTDIRFADSSTLNVMLLLLRTGRLVLAGPIPAQLARLLDLTGAGELFPTAGTVEAARVL
ncbi:STAS domain-containing protein [Streptomyces sp. NPDC002602]|uniref:STAS domain-containing protein n=1 Tax=Streptomyces sp. NPDC002602 TaxID=3364654 RepID=UPI0036CF2CF9